MTTPFPATLRNELAPTGTLRVGLNFSNFLLTAKDPATGAARGIAADIGKEIADRAGVPVTYIGFDSPGAMADRVNDNIWDIAFLGAEPARAAQIAFTAAYLEIESTYLVPAGSPIRGIDEVDRPGVRISVSNRSAYELYLSRTIKQATLLRVDGIEPSYQQFVEQKLEALAGLLPRLVSDRDRLPGSRILEGRFTAVQQAIGTVKARSQVAGWLRTFVEEAKAAGLIGQIIERNGVRGVSVAPPA